MSWRPRVVSAPVMVMVGEGLFARLSFSLVGFALPLYARQLGMSLSEIGLLISLNVAVAMAFKPTMGWAADHFGWRRSILAGVGLRSVVPLLLAFCAWPWQLFGVRAIHGLSEAVREPAANTLLAVHGDQQKAVASAFAWYGTARSAGGALGHAASGVLLSLSAGNFPLVFGVAFAVSLLPFWLVARYIPHDVGAARAAASNEAETATVNTAAEPAAAPTVEATPPARPGVLPIAGLGLFVATTAQMLHGFLPILATEYAGLSPAETGIIYALSTVVVLVAGPLFGWLSDNVSRKLVLSVRSGANVVSSGIYLAAPGLPGMVVGTCVDDLGKAAFRPAWGALMARASEGDDRRRARRMGVTSLGEDAGNILGPILAGLIWSTWGVVAMLGVRIALAAVSEAYAWGLGRKWPAGV